MIENIQKVTAWALKDAKTGKVFAYYLNKSVALNERDKANQVSTIYGYFDDSLEVVETVIVVPA